MTETFGVCSKEEVEAFYRQVGANVRKFREKKGMSQLDAALEIGIKSVAFYSNCENGRYGKHFNLEHLYCLSKCLDVELAVLLA